LQTVNRYITEAPLSLERYYVLRFINWDTGRTQ